MRKISVLITTYGRSAKLKKLLESIFRFVLLETAEVIVFVNGADKETEAVLAELAASHNNIRCVKSSRVNRAEARNTLIKMSEGKILYFLDDDVVVDKDVFALIDKKFQEYGDISIIGGPNLNMRGSSLFQECQGLALASCFGTLWVSQRYKRSGKDRRVDESGLILCNLAAKKEIFAETNIRFPGDFISAEENLLLARFARLGYKAMYIPELEVFHERRNTYRAFFRQIISYGRGRAQVFKTFPAHISPIYFILAGLLLCLSTTPFIRPRLYFNALLIYLLLDILFSLKISCQKKNLREFLPLLLIFPTIHFAYMFGLLTGILNKRSKIRL